MSLEDQITELLRSTHPGGCEDSERFQPGDLVGADWYNTVEDALNLLAREVDALKS